MWSRVLRVLFVAYVAMTALHIGWVVHHEPFAFDAWNVAIDTHAKPFTVGNFFDYWKLEYTHSNPRFGQPFDVPRLQARVVRGDRDAARVSRAVARDHDPRARAAAVRAWVATSRCGRSSLGVAVVRAAAGRQDAVLSRVLRELHLRRSRSSCGSSCRCASRQAPRRPRSAIAYAMLGVVAGMCNEHTGPTLCAFMLGYAWWQAQRPARRASRGPARLGAIIGFAAIFFAPGQDQRYDDLAQKMSLFGRLLSARRHGERRDRARPDARRRAGARADRDRRGDGDRDARARESRTRSSPRRGPHDRGRDGRGARDGRDDLRVAEARAAVLLRLVRACCSRACVALADEPCSRIASSPRSSRSRWSSSIYAAAHTIPLYGRLAARATCGSPSSPRATPGTVLIADSFEQVDESWWFLGDDFRDAKKRDMVATYFGLSGVVFHARTIRRRRSASPARGSCRAYTVDPPSCLDQPAASRSARSRASTWRRSSRGADRDRAAALADARATQSSISRSSSSTIRASRLPRKRILVAKWSPSDLRGLRRRDRSQGPLDHAHDRAAEGDAEHRLRDRRLSRRRRREAARQHDTASVAVRAVASPACTGCSRAIPTSAS